VITDLLKLEGVISKSDAILANN